MDVNQRQRRRHSAEFKAQVLAACTEPGASVSAVALAFKPNDNLVHQRRRGRGAPGVVHEDSRGVAEAPHQFIELPLYAPKPAALPGPSVTTAEAIRFVFRRGGLGVIATWPVSAAARLRSLAARGVGKIRVDALWLCTKPVDMRYGAERLLRGGAALIPLVDALKRFVLSCAVPHADETPEAAGPGRRQDQRVYVWAYARGAFDAVRGVVYDFCVGRGAQYPIAFLGPEGSERDRWRGTLVRDEYKAYDSCDPRPARDPWAYLKDVLDRLPTHLNIA